MPGQEDIEVTCDLITGKFNTCTYIIGVNLEQTTPVRPVRKKSVSYKKNPYNPSSLTHSLIWRPSRVADTPPLLPISRYGH